LSGEPWIFRKNFIFCTRGVKKQANSLLLRVFAPNGNEGKQKTMKNYLGSILYSAPVRITFNFDQKSRKKIAILFGYP
jgi:hypothetical protein